MTNPSADYLSGRSLSECTPKEIWAAAKTEFLDIARPRVSLSCIAIKYKLNMETLLRMANQQGWERLRANSEVAATLAVNPETRAAVVRQVDTAILRTARQIADTAGNAYLSMLEQISGMDVSDGPAEAVEEEVPGKGKHTKPKLKPGLGLKLDLLNRLTEGYGKFAKAMHEIGYTLTPGETEKASAQLQEAIPVLPPPPLELPPLDETAALPPPPPPSSTPTPSA